MDSPIGVLESVIINQLTLITTCKQLQRAPQPRGALEIFLNGRYRQWRRELNGRYGCNLKKFHNRQEDEVKKKNTDETEIQIGMQMGRKADGKKDESKTQDIS